MDTVTRDWTDGILSKLFRELNDRLPAGKENEMRWVIFDFSIGFGPWVDSVKEECVMKFKNRRG